MPTHSLINYAHWRIVSPESRLLTIPGGGFDGLIGQVWTGTARTPNVYRGVRKQRTFETAYCEYAACVALVRGTDKRLWQLADPIEDNPNYCWDDYRVNWECTVAASLLIPGSERFEIMPWPRRIFMRSYPTVNLGSHLLKPLLDAYMHRLDTSGDHDLLADTRRVIDEFLAFYQEQKDDLAHAETLGFAHPDASVDGVPEDLHFGNVWRVVHDFYKYLASWDDQEDAQRMRDALAAFYHNPTDQRAFMPASYSTELQIVFNALRDMLWPEDTVWLHGQTGIGVAISDTLMYQRGVPSPSDPDMSSLYGLAMPLIKHGVALSMVQLERVTDSGYLDGERVLLLTYEGQKPLSAAIHTALAAWVQAGNALVLFGEGDAYDTVREWWNQDGVDYARPQAHLTEILGLGRRPEAGVYACGDGWVVIVPHSPMALAHAPHGAAQVLDQVKVAYERLSLPWCEGNALVLQRGPYIVAAGMDESIDTEPVALTGRFVNLFDAQLAICETPQIQPDSRWLLYDLAHCPADRPWVIAAAGRVWDEGYDAHTLSFVVEGMAETSCAVLAQGSVRAALPTEPTAVTAKAVGASNALRDDEVSYTWDATSKTVLIRFPNRPKGVVVTVNF